MKNIFFITAIIGLACLGASCARTKQTNTNSTTTNTNQAVVNSSRITGSFATGPIDDTTTQLINLTTSGLDQPRVTIKLGTRIEWRNGDAVAHTLASDPHPGHTSLPGFGQSIAAGASYTYVFTQTGTFGYHDDLNPVSSQFQGHVIVE